MKFVILLLAWTAISCQGTTTDRDDIAGSKESSLATILQPLEARIRNDEALSDRRSRELTYFGSGYNYNPYTTQYNPYIRHSQYNPYNPHAGGMHGFGGAGDLNGIGFAGAGGVLGGGFAGYGYPGIQTGYGMGNAGYPYHNGLNALQSPYGYGNQLGGYYNRGLYI
ncbi:RNA-binding protein FUS-like [Anopheles cruzii]|uniref:RNA-binding protein FUS-like n=1 Tax=Anopheles cruzii TaxID=68878 RepID=UPI0022EC256D|nr:RNA-binding protein FUS-like [Anopheles cruzii]